MQSQLTYLSLAFNAGNGLSIFGGLFCDKYGPRPTILVGNEHSDVHPMSVERGNEVVDRLYTDCRWLHFGMAP